MISYEVSFLDTLLSSPYDMELLSIVFQLGDPHRRETMPETEEIKLFAHLMRRAGFGASREELEARASKGYEATVEELLNPEDLAPIDDALLFRFMPGYEMAGPPALGQAEWVYRMINTQRPLEEKMALFWHQLFATGNSKVDNPPELTAQIALFRAQGLGKFRNLLIELAKNPAMGCGTPRCSTQRPSPVA